MVIVEKYTGEKTYMFPNGHLGTKEAVLTSYPAALTFTHIIETDENREVMYAINNLSVARSMYNIDPLLNDDEAIAKIQEIRNTPPPEPEPAPPSAEERIAAALEYQVINSMPDVNTDEEVTE